MESTVAPSFTDAANKVPQNTLGEEEYSEVLFHGHTKPSRDFGSRVSHFTAAYAF